MGLDFDDFNPFSSGDPISTGVVRGIFGDEAGDAFAQIADPLGLFDMFKTPDVTQMNVPELPQYLTGQTDIKGMITFEDRTRIRNQRSQQALRGGRQGTVLGGGVPVAPSAPPGQSLAGSPASTLGLQNSTPPKTVLGM